MERKRLETELELINGLKKKVMKSLDASTEMPEGRIRCHMSRGKYPQYYLINEKDQSEFPHGRFLKSTELNIARQLVKREYDQKFMEELKRQERILRSIGNYREDALTKVYENMPEAKKRLIQPYILSDYEYEKEWSSIHTGERNPFPPENVFLTDRGEHVRSKSEKMIADYLFKNNITYAYEAELVLGGHKTVYPDFTLLNRRTRETYYLEHMGRMDSPDYCKKALMKIDLYEENGLFVGRKLFITMESSLKPIQMKQIERIAELLIN